MVRRPKIYLTDSGFFHYLQMIETEDQLLSHSKLGPSGKRNALERVANVLKKETSALFLWQTHIGSEFDLLLQSAGKKWGIQFNLSAAPISSKSMQITYHDLQLSHPRMVYPRDSESALTKNFTAMPLTMLVDENILSMRA